MGKFRLAALVAAAAMAATTAQAAVTLTLTFDRLADAEGDAGSISWQYATLPSYSNQTLPMAYNIGCTYSRPADGISSCLGMGQAYYYPDTSGALFPGNGGADNYDAFGFDIPNDALTEFEGVGWWFFETLSLQTFGSFESSDHRATLDITGFNEIAVPEPSTWALMILGFGAAGAMLRRRAPALA